ncbi:MAG: Rieske 2Fe-2S domain-containing protein [Actinomycetota bacterium]|nr:Rieske 2Fe-2S domain-containing protein [Actinomycetota bacterium]
MHLIDALCSLVFVELWPPDNGAWRCPSHGSTYAVNGKVTGGPAERDLAAVMSVFKNGVLTFG